MSTLATAPAPAASASVDAGTVRIELLADGAWIPVCHPERLGHGRGVAVLLPDDRQAAVFRDRHDRLYAVANQDPFTGAYVLSRGLLGSTADGRVYVASPLLKQRFDLSTGECLDDPEVRIEVYELRLV